MLKGSSSSTGNFWNGGGTKETSSEGFRSSQTRVPRELRRTLGGNPLRRVQDLPAGRRQVVQRDLRLRLWRRRRRRRRLWMQHRVGEPPVEILAAAIACGHRLLRLAFGAVGRTPHAEMEMIV